MSVGTYPAKVSIKIDGHEITEAGTYRAVSSDTIVTGLSFSMTVMVTHEVHTHGVDKHRHERLDGGRLGPATHFEKTNT